VVRVAFLDADGPIAFAHRGGAKLWPENTVEAFQGTLDLGLTYAETDLRMTRDGVIVCMHDPTVDRTTNGSGHVAAHSLAEIKELDAGCRFVADDGSRPFAGKGVAVPTLEEVLALDSRLRLNVEIKKEGPDLIGTLLDLIDSRGLHDRLLVAAERDAIGNAFRQRCAGRVPTSAGWRGVVRFLLGARTGLHRWDSYSYDALQVPFRRGPVVVVSPRFLCAAHSHGLKVHVWTVDDPALMPRLLSMGVDGLMTDRPDVLAGVLGAV